MSVLEIVNRLWRMAYLIVRKYKAGFSPRTLFRTKISWLDSSFKSISFLDHLRYRKAPFFYFYTSPETAVSFCTHYPDAHASLIHTANRIGEGFIPFWGLGEQEVGTEVRWNRDPLTKGEWPICFQGDINYQHSDEIGDIRTVWELNRHQWMVPLAQAFFLSGEARYADYIEGLLASWIEANPVDKGVNWISSMELAIRVNTWMWIAYYSGMGSDKNRLSDCLAKAIYQHTRHVERNLARFSSANNHLLMEAGTLALVGMLFPEFRCSSRWLRKGLALLESELTKQVLPDGVNAEQAVHYHTFVLEMVLLVIILAERNQVTIAAQIRNTARKMAAFLAALTDPSGKVPHLGDSDDGCVIRLASSEENHSRALLAVCAVLFQEPEFKINTATFPETAYWLLGASGKECYDSMPVRQWAPDLEVFPHGGYAISRGGIEKEKGRFVFSAGPHGFGQLCAHAHADALSFTFSIDGLDVIVDPGTYIYNIEEKCRNAFRATEAHNTIGVDGRDQSQILGPFLWGQRADAVLASYRSESWCHFVCGYHDGYAPVRHYRYVMYLEGGIWIIVDRLVGDDQLRKYEQYFQLHRHIEPLQRDDVIEMWHGEEMAAKMWLLSPPDLQVDIIPTQASEHFLEKHSTKKIRATKEGRGEVVFTSLLTLGDTDLDIVERQEGFLHFKAAGFNHFLAINGRQTELLDFFGTYLYLMCIDELEVEELFVFQGERLFVAGEQLADFSKVKEEYYILQTPR